jgi:hypothetical protein
MGTASRATCVDLIAQGGRTGFATLVGFFLIAPHNCYEVILHSVGIYRKARTVIFSIELVPANITKWWRVIQNSVAFFWHSNVLQTSAGCVAQVHGRPCAFCARLLEGFAEPFVHFYFLCEWSRMRHSMGSDCRMYLVCCCKGNDLGSK